jgi:tRNA threonylcarbamoyl adenosine modification protein YeaZ
VKILALETSSECASVAFGAGERREWSHSFAAHRRLSAELAVHVEALVRREGRADVIVVGLGPGSYAGVRVAIATAVGLAAVWGCELWGIPSVTAFASGEIPYQVVGDARRGSWYYSQVEVGICTQGPLLAHSEEELRDWIRRGSGDVWSTEECASVGVPIRRGVPSAEFLLQRACLNHGIVATGDLEPLYLREVSITRPKD